MQQMHLMRQPGKGWWYGTADGWYAKSKAYTIDGISYQFTKNGYSSEK